MVKKTNRAIISLGSNVNKEENLPASIRLLAKWCRVVAVSPVYETLPVGLPDQPNFFNAAVIVETEMQPAALKKAVLSYIEERLNRIRTGNRNAPRTIDLDLALFNDEVREYDGHEVPDPDVLHFAHVAVPIADMAPKMRHPQTGETMAKIAARLMHEATARNEGNPMLWLRPDVSLRGLIDNEAS
jgi:2-amino-4-hydroxy-6-hydroxymethyldihydropteridine diphosphokinase